MTFLNLLIISIIVLISLIYLYYKIKNKKIKEKDNSPPDDIYPLY